MGAILALLASLVGMTSLLIWAVYDPNWKAPKRSISTRSSDLSEIREDLGSLTAHLPPDVQNRFISEISKRLKDEIRKMAGKSEASVSVFLEGSVIKAFLSEDGESGYLIEFSLP